jgi:hypothetical protein
MRPAPYDYFKVQGAANSAKGAGTYYDYFLAAGYPGGLAVAPTLAGAQCNAGTIGALNIGNSPAGEETWLSNIQGFGSLGAGLALYDRLVHHGGALGNVTTVQNFTAVALPRYTDGVGVTAWLEFYAGTGATAANVTVTYINTANVTRSVVVAMPVSPVVGQLVPIQLVSGDLGVKRIVSVQLSVSAGSAGSFGVTLMRRLCKFGVNPNQGINLNWLACGMPPILDNACLGVMGMMSSTVVGGIDLLFDFSDV